MVPKLRFKNFDGEWESKSLNDIACLTSSKRVHLSDYVKEGIPFFRGKEITELNNGIIPSDILYISPSLFNDFKVKHGAPKKGEILITAVGTLGNIYHIGDLGDFYFKDGNLIWLKELKCDSLFLSFLLTLKKNEILNSAIGSTQKALTMVELNKLVFNYPKNDEQTKVANFISSVDEKITLLNKQYNLLRQYKKGMMQNIFDQEVRFRDDNGDIFPAWQENTLSNLGNVYNGLTGKTAEDFGEGKFFITYKQIFDNRIIHPKGFGLVNISKDEKQNKVKYGDLFFTTSSETPDEVAFCSVFLETELSDCYLNSFCFGYRVNNIDKNNPVFLSFLFRSEYFRAKVKTLAQGSTRYNISKAQFMMLSVSIPVTKEQTKIGNFLTALDDKIAVKKAELDQLKTWKQGLLQQMFV
ncbi:restriction endonuclease subunit S [Klebsiella pneumoniae]|uniref:restriction endonuclease subunit S n=1 Tax=Klebsiella pneumoniae TaxID=573 RepID=UPI0019B563E7|nr:restriction endonuclease subunit S [Klebsiella pneumoniae]ELA1550180.1 restriction endonuclease subunit S [Klebsiella pneumoniae]MBC5201766.1 restriction endonuclease subunit S [Klebsiella pneumoniae]UYH26587.1 restriction endonuclease subunit S [Klebsiella pneumoniae]